MAVNGNGALKKLPGMKPRAKKEADKPPFDESSEKWVLGSLLLAARDPAYREIVEMVVSMLNPDDFFIVGNAVQNLKHRRQPWQRS